MPAFTSTAVGNDSRVVARPDGRRFLIPGARDRSRFAALVAEEEINGLMHLTIDPTDGELAERAADAGFREVLRHDIFEIPLDGVPRRIPELTGIRLTSPLLVDRQDLRRLDDDLRGLIPGTDGWHWSPGDFDNELDGPGFQPDTYAVAVEDRTGSLVGLARVWLNAAGPRVGCVAVATRYHRTRVAGALIVTVANATRRLGHAQAVTEIASHNIAAQRLARRYGATAVGQQATLVRRQG